MIIQLHEGQLGQVRSNGDLSGPFLITKRLPKKSVKIIVYLTIDLATAWYGSIGGYLLATRPTPQTIPLVLH